MLKCLAQVERPHSFLLRSDGIACSIRYEYVNSRHNRASRHAFSLRIADNASWIRVCR